MPKIIITGGLGFIFSHVTQYFVKKGWKVIVIDNESIGSHPEIIDGSFIYVKMDVKNATRFIMHENPDYIIHAAAISDVDFSIHNPLKTIGQNTTANLVVFESARYCSNLKKLLYVSTDEVYGECEYKKREEDIIFPKNPYAMSKAHGSLLRMAYDNTYEELKDKTCETRFCNVFGGRQDNRKILGAIKESLEKDKAIPVHNEGKGYREYIYVKNIPPAIDLILEKGNQTYNITLNEGFIVKDLITRVEEVTGKTIKTKKAERKGMDMKYQMDNSRILALGWKPLFTFDEGLKDYLK